MNKKWAPYILIAVMLVALLVIKLARKEKGTSPRTTIEKNDPASTPNRERGFDRRTAFLEYSKHANCRMDCRHITKAEVVDIMQAGKINYNKSDLKNARCPRYAVEGVTKDRQEVRIVFAQCNEKTVVVTVIDLETEYECHCPGDDEKYQNKNR